MHRIPHVDKELAVSGLRPNTAWEVLKVRNGGLGDTSGFGLWREYCIRAAHLILRVAIQSNERTRFSTLTNDSWPRPNKGLQQNRNWADRFPEPCKATLVFISDPSEEAGFRHEKTNPVEVACPRTLG
jgi:hypothetical protein